MPLVSFVTTCKSRLDHLKLTLPLMTGQSNSEVIVVDYGCPDGAAAWVRANHPGVRVVEVGDDPGFSVARARNIGAARATGRFLCFIDADIRLQGDLGAWVAKHGHEGRYYVASTTSSYSICGTVVCHRDLFAAAGGYDEAFRGWGGEDGDLYQELLNVGGEKATFPADLLSAIEHGDESRYFGNGIPAAMANRDHSLNMSRLYRAIKKDIRLLTRTLPSLPARQRLFQLVRDKYQESLNPGKKNKVEVIVRLEGIAGTGRGTKFGRSLHYAIPWSSTALPVIADGSLTVALFFDDKAVDLASTAFINLVGKALDDRGHRVMPVRIGSAVPAGIDVGILHVNSTWLEDSLLDSLPAHLPILNRGVRDISKRSISSLLLSRDDRYSGKVIVKSNVNFAGVIEIMKGRLTMGEAQYIPYKIYGSLAKVPEHIWLSEHHVVEKFVPEMEDGKYCLRKWVFLGDRSLHLMDVSEKPIIKAASSQSRELPLDIPEELVRRRRQLGFDYGKFDYVMADGQAILLDANSTPGFSASSEKLRNFAATLADGLHGWLREQGHA